MYRLLIVDDEDIIRKGLKVMIQDLGFDFSDFYEAENGLKALEVVEKNNPDMILADIKMPRMDGIEFLKKLRQNGNNTRVLILTGHSEFEYAREALRYKAGEYLLKPVKRDELSRAIKSVLNDLREETEKQILLNNQSRALNNSLSDLMEKKFKDALSQHGKKRVNFSEFLMSEGVALNLPEYMVFYGQGQVLTSADNIMKDSNWQSLIKVEMSKTFMNSLVFSISENTVAAIINFDGALSKENIVEKLDEIKRVMLQINILMSWGISQSSNKADEIPMLFHQSKIAVKEILLYGSGKVFFNNDRQLSNVGINITDSDITKMVAFLEIENYSKLYRFVTELLNEYMAKTTVTGKCFEDTLCKILLQVTSHFKGDESASSFVNGSVYELIEQLSYCNSREEAIKLLMDVLVKTITASGDGGKLTGGKKAILFAKQYIQNYYNKDINLDMIANQVSMNPSYFSVLFKKEEGLSLVDYINDIRINKAMEYLRDPQYKIYEVAEKVGFNDEKYFCKVFKKKVEVSPTEYREKNRSSFNCL